LAFAWSRRHEKLVDHIHFSARRGNIPRGGRGEQHNGRY
jgi:hypothetical protein